MRHLTVHPVTGDSAIGFRKDGRAIWPIKGGSGESGPTPTADSETPEPTDGDKPAQRKSESPADGEALGDAGKRALSAERDARKSAEKERDEAHAEISRLRRTNAAQEGTDVGAIKTEIRAEFTAQLAAAAVRTEAKGRMSDPSDAARYTEYFEGVDASDEAAITAAMDKLLKDKPHLAAAEAPHWGSVGGGDRTPSEREPASPLERMRRGYGSA